MSEPVISFRCVGKSFVKYDDRAQVLGFRVRLGRRSRRSQLWAVRDVDLSVNAGESVGVMGRNGAGKSTMLQMLAGVTAPSVGTVKVDGRVSPLISVGVGFHPELTGRENVYVNGAILGMSRGDVDRRFDEIVAFAEIDDFIDTPVKFYSSGMFVRLGFSVAIAADPDILLVDEVLAVGDFAFQLKCYERMQEIRSAGTTIVVVSHNLGALRSFCDRGVVLNRGRVIHDGSMFDAIGVYHGMLSVDDESASDDLADQQREPDALDVLDARLVDADGNVAAHVRAADTLVLRATVRANRDIDRLYSGILVGTTDREICVYSDSNRAEPYPFMRRGDVRSYDVRIPANFPTGSYTAKLTFYRHVDQYNSSFLDRTPEQSFYVSGRPLVGGLSDLRAQFAVTASPGT